MEYNKEERIKLLLEWAQINMGMTGHHFYVRMFQQIPTYAEPLDQPVYAYTDGSKIVLNTNMVAARCRVDGKVVKILETPVQGSENFTQYSVVIKPSAPSGGAVVQHDLPVPSFPLKKVVIGAELRSGEVISTGLEKETIRAVMSHELNHVMFHHTRTRTTPKEPEIWRLALELEADSQIPKDFGVHHGFTFEMAQELKTRNIQTTEEIYLFLLEEKKTYLNMLKRKGNHFIDDGGLGTGDEGGPPVVDPAEIIGKIIVAADLCEGYGDVPGNISGLISNLRRPRIDWREQFRHIWGTKVGVWDVNTRQISSMYYQVLKLNLPPLNQTHGLPDVVFGIDTSGSMVGSPLEDCISEMRGLSGLATDVEWVMFDAIIQGSGRLSECSDDELMELVGSLKGSGGTSFIPLFDLLKEREAPPQLLVILTDTWGSFPDWTPTYPVLWVVPHHVGVEIPFGEVCRIPTEEISR